MNVFCFLLPMHFSALKRKMFFRISFCKRKYGLCLCTCLPCLLSLLHLPCLPSLLCLLRLLQRLCRPGARGHFEVMPPPNHRLCSQARNMPPKLGLRYKKSVGSIAVGWHFEAVPYQIAACASQKWVKCLFRTIKQVKSNEGHGLRFCEEDLFSVFFVL